MKKKKNKPAKKFQKRRLAAVPGARDVENPEAPQSFIFPLFFFPRTIFRRDARTGAVAAAGRWGD